GDLQIFTFDDSSFQLRLSIDGQDLTRRIPPVSKSAVVGCGGEQETKTEYSSFVPDVVAGKFGSLVLNALPKGNRPGSGPSKKTNDVKT
ncbi:unnamed protein product, partial [Arabidopsis halleri]